MRAKVQLLSEQGGVARLSVLREQPGVLGEGLITGAYKDSDYRLLSSGYVAEDGIDIPAELLPETLPLFGPSQDAQGHPKYLLVYIDHQASASKWIGQLLKAWLSEATDQLQAGIDGTIRVDLDRDERLTGSGVSRGILRAVSTAWDMEAIRSHPSMAADEFLRRIGETVDGQRVRWIAKKITFIREVSFVWEGADETARKIRGRRASDPRGGSMNWLEKLRELLELGADVDEAGVLAALEAKLAEATAMGEELMSLQQAMGTETTEAAVEEAKRAKSDLLGEKATRLVDGAIADNKVDKAKRETLIAEAKRNYDGAVVLFGALPAQAGGTRPKPAVGALGGGNQAGAQTGAALTPEQVSVNRQLKLDDETWKKHNPTR